MSEVFFSVIIPAYNAENFIGETLRSIVAQTYSDFEVIVADDASSDRTAEIVKEFQRDDPRFSYYLIPRQGNCGGPRNHALRYAKGRYAAFLDADDLWAPSKLEQYHRHIESTGAGFLFSNGVNIDSSGKPLGVRLHPKMKQLFPVQDPFLLFSNIIGVSSVVVRRDLLREDPFSLMKEVRAVEDYRVWLELNLKTEVHYLSDSLFFYRIHNNQLSNSYVFMLDQMENVLAVDGIGLAERHGESLISLAREVINVRRKLVQGKYRDALAAFRVVFKSMGRRERSTFLEYVHYGLGHTIKSGVLRKSKRVLRLN